MAEFSYPGVYVREVPSGPAPVQSASVSTGSMVGFTLRGETDTPRLVTSFSEFSSVFGGFTASSLLPTSAFAFFANGGTRLRVVRVVASDAVKSAGDITEAIGGVGGTPESIVPDTLPTGALTTMVFTADVPDNLPLVPGTVSVTSALGGVTATDDGNGGFTAAGGVTSGFIDYTTGEMSITYAVAPALAETFTASYSYVNIKATMKWAGAEGNNFRVRIEGDPKFEDLPTASFSRFVLFVEEQDSGGDFVEVESFPSLDLTDSTSTDYITTVVNDPELGSEYVQITTYGDTGNPTALQGEAVTGEALTNVPAFDGVTKVFTYTLTKGSASPFSVSLDLKLVDSGGVLDPGSLQLEDDGGGAIVVKSTSTLFGLDTAGVNTIDYDTGVITLTFRDLADPAAGPGAGGAPVQTADYHSKAAQTSVDATLSGGANGSAISRTVVSAPALAADKKGIYALDKTEESLSVCIPDFETNATVSQDLIDYCDGRFDRFAVISAPEGFNATKAKRYRQRTLARNTSRAALYYPHIKIIDPVTNRQSNHPPGGHVMGIFARTDQTRNVSKAPAGTVDGALAFAQGVEIENSLANVGELNLAGVNNIVNYDFSGLTIWGARTLEQSGDFPYVNQRRLFMFVEKSVFNSAQQFVFESNTAGLRASVKAVVEAFLLELFVSGHFAGNSPQESFFVVCDESNNPAGLVEKGFLYVDVGLAPTTPAEFVVFRFQRKTLS